jgi:hypothetical protein
MQDMITEIKYWKKIATDWQQTAEMLAIELGDVSIAHELYDDISSGLYEKVRSRLTHDHKPSSEIHTDSDEEWFDLIPDSSRRGL